MTNQWGWWLGFNGMVIFLLLIDLLVFNKKAHEIKLKEALSWSFFWIALSLCLVPVVQHIRGGDAGKLYLAGYLLEKALSVDNLFVFVLIFKAYKVDPKYQHRVLFWGIIGALVLRGAMILVGGALVARFNWLLYIFGLFLVYTSIKLMAEEEENPDPAHSPIMKIARKVLPISKGDAGDRLTTRVDGKFFFTPLFVVLLVVETSDLIFALDSIPAIFGITTDTFIIYTSNVMAILGLRALYFALAGLVDMFHYLRHGLSTVLGFIGVKMLLPALPPGMVDLGLPVVDGHYHIPVEASLLVICLVFVMAIIASMMRARRDAS